jgi:hypothetical protein
MSNFKSIGNTKSNFIKHIIMKNSIEQLSKNELQQLSGGSYGWPILVLYEIIDVITSSGENIRTAYENGKKAGYGK